MSCILYPLLVFGFILISVADSEVQTDWSGGAGILGPVITLGNEFYLDTDVYYGYPSDLSLQTGRENIVDDHWEYTRALFSEDVNGDGKMDVLGAAFFPDDISWWENVDGSGTVWAEHLIDGEFNGATSVFAADINGDGYMDAIGAAFAGGDVTWWENEDGSGNNWTEHVINDNLLNPFSVCAADVNGDGYLDVLYAGGFSIFWWENVDGSGNSWIQHTVGGYFPGAVSVCASDVNGDGLTDVIGAGSTANKISWWENLDGSGTVWAEHTVKNDFSAALCVTSEDVNGDGNTDIIGVAKVANQVAWWENIGGSGTVWAEHMIDDDFAGAFSVASADVDGDGSMDVLGAGLYADRITCWKNISGTGTIWEEHVLDDDFRAASSVYSADLNDDGLMDVLGASYYSFEISWWDLSVYLPTGGIESSILYIQSDPDWEWIDWTSTLPSSTSVSIQVRASDDYSNMGEWSDTLYSPSSLEGILADNDSYFQYRVILSTTDPDATPILNDVTVTWDPLLIEETDVPIGSSAVMLPVSPNPSTGPPVFRFGLPASTYVILRVFDLSGRLLMETPGSIYPPGYHHVQMSDGMIPGVYFCTMTAGDSETGQRFMILD